MSVRRRLLLSLASLGAALVAIDLAVGVLLVRDGTFRGRPLPPYAPALTSAQRSKVDERRAALLEGALEGTSPFDAELGWTNRPTAWTPDRKDGFNRLAARGRREYDPVPPPGVLRIASFGDSFTHCAQVGWLDSWQAQLEELEPGWEALNLGVNGYGTDQAFLRYRRVGRDLGAQVVCIGLMLDNLARNVNRYKPALNRFTTTVGAKPRFLLVEGQLQLLPQPYPTELEMLEAAADGTLAARLREGEHWVDPDLPAVLWRSSLVRLAVALQGRRVRDLRRLWLDRDGEPRRVTLAILEAFHREALADGARAAPVLIWPPEGELVAYLERGERYWERGLLDELDALGIPWIDLCEALAEAVGQDPGEVAALYTGNHLSRAGNAVVARSVRAWIRARGLAEEAR